MRPRHLALALTLALAVAAAPALGTGVRTTWRAADALAVAEALLADERVRGLADTRSPFLLRVDVVDGADVTVRYEDGAVAPAEGVADYTLRLREGAALAALNAPDPQHALRCLHAAGALQGEARAPTDMMALRAARADLDCAPPEGALETAPGLFVLGDAAFDRLGIPLGWQDPDAPRWLGRADAGIARLAPDAMPGRVIALGEVDPWGAASTPQVRPYLQDALDCPCAAPPPLVPAGDWRAAVAADPRAQGAPP